MKMIRAYQFLHNNQLVIEYDNAYYLQSYQSLVVCITKKDLKVLLGEDWNYSKTTLRHVYAFIEEYTGHRPTRKELMTKWEHNQRINNN